MRMMFLFFVLRTFPTIISIVDVDECASSGANDCDPNAVCTNTEGSYVCRCGKGYTGDGKTCIGNTKSELYSFRLTLSFKKVIHVLNTRKKHQRVTNKWAHDK